MKKKLLAAFTAIVCAGTMLAACSLNTNISETETTTQAPLTGWQEQDGIRYYYLSDGTPACGWTEVDGVSRYFDEDGAIVSGWTELADGRCYLTEEGTRACGWTLIDGVNYYLDENGAAVSGWVEFSDSRSYFNEDGTPACGWLDTEEGMYYLNENGTPLTLWQDLDAQRYYFGDDGIMVTGWIEDGEYTYYLQDNGVMATGTTQIDGVDEYFTPKGIHILLVNPWCYVPDDYAANLLPLSNGQLVEESCYDALVKMLEDCTEAGFQPLVCSAYRTDGDQQYLFNRKVNSYIDQGYSSGEAWSKAKTIVALPGTSEHQLGLAVDIVDVNRQILDYEQANTPTQQWLMEHCWEYGFILRYPKDTTDVTGIIWEPWHYRYVGYEVAQEILAANVTLEEYIGFTHE